MRMALATDVELIEFYLCLGVDPAQSAGFVRALLAFLS